MMTEVALLGQIAMICMLRHATALSRRVADIQEVDAEVSRDPFVRKTSLRMLKTALSFLEEYPSIITVASFFNFLRLDLPYAYVARSILSNNDGGQREEEKELLRGISRSLEAVSQEIDSLKPLVWTTSRVNWHLESGPSGTHV